MVKNFFLIAIRHLSRHKLFSLINIGCLAIGITFTMLIGVFVLHEKNINGEINHIADQYVLKSKWKMKDMGLEITTTAPLARALKESYPSLVENYYRFNPVTNVVSAGERHFKENIAIGDTTLVSMYGFDLLHGNGRQAFPGNTSALITEVMAQKLFGTADAVGKTITITTTTSEKQDYTVSGVLKGMPYNSVNNFLDADGFNVFVPFEGNHFFQGEGQQESWDNTYIVGMIQVKKGVRPEDLQKPVAQLLAKNLPARVNGQLEADIVPLRNYYLRDNNGAAQKMMETLSLVALFILLMAIINFVNISIGTSSYRLKEIGLRKVFGSARGQLIAQHLTESLVFAGIAALLSLLLYELARPVFSQILSVQLEPFWRFGFGELGRLLLLVLLLGLIAGIYPAFVLSSSNILHSVKGKIGSARGGLVLRKTLLVVQFTLAIGVFISALNVSRQISFLFNKDLGYQKDQLLVLTAFPKQWDSTGVSRMEAIRGQLAQLPSVKQASLSFEVPDRMPPNTIPVVPDGSTSGQQVLLPTVVSDEHFASTFGLSLKEGSFFRENKEGYIPGQIVLNESAVKAMGWTTATGRILRIQPGNFEFTVAGVIKDFNYSSFQQGVGPIAFVHVNDNTSYRFLTLKLAGGDIASSIDKIKNKWKELSPGAPFEYSFMDERFRSLYLSELKLKKAAGVATILNLVIVFMGIFGVIAFTLAKREKEIAVRKVLGARVRGIILLFIRDYTVLIFLANLIAWPLAWWVTDRWLHNYAYRMQQGIVPYLYVSLFVFAVAFIVITAQCFRTATANPVTSLRAE